MKDIDKISNQINPKPKVHTAFAKKVNLANSFIWRARKELVAPKK